MFDVKWAFLKEKSEKAVEIRRRLGDGREREAADGCVVSLLPVVKQQVGVKK